MTEIRGIAWAYEIYDPLQETNEEISRNIIVAY